MYKIKKDIQEKDLEEFKSKIMSLKYNKKKLQDHIQEKVNECKNSEKKAIWELIDSHYPDILIAKPDALNNFKKLMEWQWANLPWVKAIKEANTAYENLKWKRDETKKKQELKKKIKQEKDDENAFLEEMKKIFEPFYTEFSKKEGYWLAKLLAVHVCPYCNRNYTFTVVNSKKKKEKKVTRPQFDHFYPKSKYPYFAVSFYNLIPSCSVCNHIKGDKDVTIFHPYVDNAVDFFDFSILLDADSKVDIQRKGNRIAFFYGESKRYKIVMQPKQNLPTMSDCDLKEIQGKLKTHNETFHLEGIYDMHKDLVSEMIQTAIIYNKSYCDGLLKQFGGDLFRDEADIKRFIIRNYAVNEGGENRPFSKLVEDISNQFGLNL